MKKLKTVEDIKKLRIGKLNALINEYFAWCCKTYNIVGLGLIDDNGHKHFNDDEFCEWVLNIREKEN